MPFVITVFIDLSYTPTTIQLLSKRGARSNECLIHVFYLPHLSLTPHFNYTKFGLEFINVNNRRIQFQL